MEPADTDVTGPDNIGGGVNGGGVDHDGDKNDGDKNDGGTGNGGAPSGGQGAAEPAEAPTLGELLLAVEELWPESLAENWDEVGLVAGHPSAPVTKVMFAVDPTLEVIEEAVEWGAELLITHHPLLLKGVTSVAATTPKGRAVHRLIESGTALLTVHTNGDSAVGGVSDVLADALGLQDAAPLTVAANGLPEEGIGRVGDLAAAMTLGDFAARVFGILPSVAGGVRVSGDKDGLVRRVAVCGGAGDSLFNEVRASNADVYVTADLRHHPASEAREAALNGRPYLVDVSHFASEWLWLPAAAAALGNVLADQGHDVEIQVSTTNSDPWDFILTPG
ncbi:Nif3-like dinuclear metal center hexameric protein [Arthrobacter sp. PGP41]|uniref:Nif3-like dinuclear metal center hexameric protein n=1 Tax=unclassified Arthrobacter TaxID=235627 RepID=UPI000CDC48C9|nr:MULTISPECIES: Nif3-like dinuclear metal center hexameric protein [unclassified Arthrobacter]AUZ35083.1 Nif3-like dinuclear metal center hexameric protein [Arthrobacter sp. PGP41]MDT0194167.1 Nif3-like dinuclear metal center hexameric protein [Arthrobacter sp. AB6]